MTPETLAAVGAAIAVLIALAGANRRRPAPAVQRVRRGKGRA
jgi:hypothetical protein